MVVTVERLPVVQSIYFWTIFLAFLLKSHTPDFDRRHYYINHR